MGDVATGVGALLLFRAVLQGTHTRRHVTWFTALGVGDFLVALVLGAVVRPDGLESMPWILFPTLAVPFFAIVHVVNWLQLASGGRQRPHTEPTEGAPLKPAATA